jgi:hypothetical protein
MTKHSKKKNVWEPKKKIAFITLCHHNYASMISKKENCRKAIEFEN